MNNKMIFIIGLLILLISLVACESKSVETDNIVQTQTKRNIKYSEKSERYSIEENIYTHKDIKVKYPQIDGLEDENKQEAINEIIKKDAIYIYEKTLDELEENQTYEVSGNYEIKLQADDILSIAYTSYNNIVPSAYPYNLFHTINIDINNGKVLTVEDFIPEINEEFTEILRNGKYVGEVDIKYQDQLIKFTFDNYPDDKALIETVKNTYIYVTENEIGISLPVPHVAGDYVLIEINKVDLGLKLN